MSDLDAATRHLIEVMGTVVTIDLFNCPDATGAQRALQRARDLLRDVDHVFSTYKDSSPLSRLRRGEVTLGETPPQVADVLDLCQRAKTLSAGWFDPWSLPGGLDPTGYVKGWAAQLALDEFRGLELTGVIVNAAGDLTSFGAPTPTTTFRTGVVHPSDPQRLAAVVELRGAHLFNPFTRDFTSAVASASVMGPDLGLCDALATALSVGGNDVMVLIDQIDGYDALTIDLDATIRATPGFPLVRD
jgi:thiamine biosynthesis lipoprotein